MAEKVAEHPGRKPCRPWGLYASWGRGRRFCFCCDRRTRHHGDHGGVAGGIHRRAEHGQSVTGSRYWSGRCSCCPPIARWLSREQRRGTLSLRNAVRLLTRGPRASITSGREATAPDRNPLRRTRGGCHRLGRPRSMAGGEDSPPKVRGQPFAVSSTGSFTATAGAVLLDPDVGDGELRARLLSTVPEGAAARGPVGLGLRAVSEQDEVRRRAGRGSVADACRCCGPTANTGRPAAAAYRRVAAEDGRGRASPTRAQSDSLAELHARSRSVRLADLLIEVENDLGFSVHFQQPGEKRVGVGSEDP